MVTVIFEQKILFKNEARSSIAKTPRKKALILNIYLKWIGLKIKLLKYAL